MSLIKKYDQTLRRKFALRAVWTPGTKVHIGDIMILKDNALTMVGNLKDENIQFTETSIAETQSMSIKSNGVSQSLLQNGVKVSMQKLDPKAEAELQISFNSEDSYLLKTPRLTGTGMEQSMKIARQIAKLPKWDFRDNYIVHKVWTAEEFTFLGTMEKGKTVTFNGTGEAIKGLLKTGINAENTITSGHMLSYKVVGSSGPVVMQVFRVKKNGEIY